MNNQYFAPPATPLSGVAGAAIHVATMTELLREKSAKRQKIELNDWEEEGGSLAVPVTAPPGSNAPGSPSGSAQGDAYVGNIVDKNIQ